MTFAANTATPPAILLVDDDPDARMILRDAAAEAVPGATIWEVGSGEEAMDFLYARGRHSRAPRPSLITLDIEMPGEGGQTTLAKIRRDGRFADIPVVVLTSRADDVQKRLAAVNGANSFALKPATPAELGAAIRQITEYWTQLHQRPACEDTDGPTTASA
ncbi:MAG: response regulator [Planctomycetes bacterium]|nr:response regulator [Planctomycetota bacterium]